MAQLFGRPVFDDIKPIVEGYLTEMESTKLYDRHKTRAMWEFIAVLGVAGAKVARAVR
jgi:proteasome activator subunit 4